MERVSLRLSDDLDEEIEDHIGYGNKSEFFREAVREKLDREGDGDNANEDEPEPASAES